MKTDKRDPCQDPQPGDVVVLRTGRFRKVTERNGNDIHYKAGEGYGNPAKYKVLGLRKSRICWITTWQDWCHKNDVVDTYSDK